MAHDIHVFLFIWMAMDIMYLIVIDSIYYNLFCGVSMNILKVKAATSTALNKPQGDEEAEGFSRLPLKMAWFWVIL